MAAWPGAPGYINFYEAASVVSHAGFHDFFDAIKALLPTSMTVQVPGVGDIIDETNGLIVGAYSFAVPAVVTGTGGGNYSGGSGAVVDWKTSGVVAGRRPMGRSFLVPLIASAMNTSGAISAASITIIGNAATALITAMGGDFKVWSRPFAGGPGGVPAARSGSQHSVVSATVPSLAAQLRSRRT